VALKHDRYEGFPKHYVKKSVWVRPLGKKKVRAFMYVMAPGLEDVPAVPSKTYFDGIFSAYEYMHLGTKALTDALIEVGEALEGALGIETQN
jgi:hypothetical protein